MKFDIILSDPPWFYNSRKNKRTKFGGGAEAQYQLMTNKEILSIDHNPIANKNCILFLWVPCPRLNFGIKCIEQWGFRYATVGFVWVKTDKYNKKLIYHPGNYSASNVELVLIGVRGSMIPELKMVQQVLIHPQLKPHSRKPEEIRNRIENMYPNKSKLEMFAREKVNKWTSIGLEITGNDINKDIRSLSEH